jgi:PHD/YefM family antitoxin component YafN of YafNO toxin-antitoxin module
MGVKMKVFTSEIVSNSEMIRNYKRCRDKAEELGKIIIMKNNQPDAILFPFAEYERLSEIIEYLESLGELDFVKVIKSLPQKENRKNYTIQKMENDLE